LAAHFTRGDERGVDASGLAGKVDVHGAGDDAAVAGLNTVEAKEVFTVQGGQDAIFATGVAKDFVIRPSLPGAFGFQNGGDIAAESPEFLDDGQGKVFVGLEPQHTGSVRLVFGNGACDFGAMGAVVGPGVGEVFGVQRGIAAEKIGFAEAKLAGAGECPDRNARAADAGFAPADGGVAVHAGETLAKVARHDLQQGRFFTRRHGGQERFGVGEKWHRHTLRKIATLQPVAKVFVTSCEWTPFCHRLRTLCLRLPHVHPSPSG
jgi:hypothetical protein